MKTVQSVGLLALRPLRGLDLRSIRPAVGAMILFVAGGASGVLAYREILNQRVATQSFAPEHADSYGLPDSAVGELALIVLAGQSNMAGYGPSDAADVHDARVFVFGNDYRWWPAREPLDRIDAQVGTVSMDAGAGVGPGPGVRDRAARPPS